MLEDQAWSTKEAALICFESPFSENAVDVEFMLTKNKRKKKKTGLTQK